MCSFRDLFGFQRQHIIAFLNLAPALNMLTN